MQVMGLSSEIKKYQNVQNILQKSVFSNFLHHMQYIVLLYYVVTLCNQGE